jgi:hypothetical protein
MADHPPQRARAQPPCAAAILGTRSRPMPSASSRSSRRRWRRTASRQNNRPRERHGDNMTETEQRETPQVGIFWLAQTTEAEPRLLAAGCPLDQAEPYGECLTYGPGHYETWARWRRDRTVEPALRALVRSYEYEDWPARPHRPRPGARSVHHLCRPQAPVAGNDRAHQNPISFAGGTHRDPKRPALSEQRDAKRARGDDPVSPESRSRGLGLVC